MSKVASSLFYNILPLVTNPGKKGDFTCQKSVKSQLVIGSVTDLVKTSGLSWLGDHGKLEFSHQTLPY